MIITNIIAYKDLLVTQCFLQRSFERATFVSLQKSSTVISNYSRIMRIIASLDFQHTLLINRDFLFTQVLNGAQSIMVYFFVMNVVVFI
jgi:hypothetical protein